MCPGADIIFIKDIKSYPERITLIDMRTDGKIKKYICILGVAWLESVTHDWLIEPRESHEQGMQGFSSSALTWTGKKGKHVHTQLIFT